MSKQRWGLKQSGRVSVVGVLALSLALGGVTPAQSEAQVMEMAAAIQKAIVTLPNYGVFDQLSFGIEQETVILRGFASRPTLKNSAEKVAKQVKGVEEVINQIEVLPLSGSDDELRADLYGNIYGDSILSRYGSLPRGAAEYDSMVRREFGITNDPPVGFHAIHIIVKAGNVTLEGLVDSAGHKVIAQMQARQTPGVFSVTNDLLVASEVQQQ
jgi:osmotically-inducible protein OsmY